MTKKEILLEQKQLQERIRVLINETMSETDFSVCKTKYDEMLVLVRRIDELDTKLKRLTLKGLKDELLRRLFKRSG